MNRFYFYLLAAFSLFPFVNAHSQFVENKGQVIDDDGLLHPEVLYTYSEGDASVYFLEDKVVYALRKINREVLNGYEPGSDIYDSLHRGMICDINRVDLEFLGHSDNISLQSANEKSYETKFYHTDKIKVEGVKSYEKLTYFNVYPNVDLVFYPNQGGLKYDIVLNENANINDVKLHYNGAENIVLSDGKLVIKTKLQDIIEDIPLSYINGNIDDVADVQYELINQTISFKTKDTYQSLVIDPSLTWCTYYESSLTTSGGLDYEYIEADPSGNLFLVSTANKGGFPNVNPGVSYQQSYGSGAEIYLAKFSPTRQLVWATFIGGNSSDYIYGTDPMALDANYLHFVGYSNSTWPLQNGGGYYNGTDDPNYYVRFNKTSGALVHSTFIGGHSSSAPSIDISSTGKVIIAFEAYDFGPGSILSKAGAYNQAANGGFVDYFFMELNSSFAQTWGTFLGGAGSIGGVHVRYDDNDNVFFTGEASYFSAGTATEHMVNPGGGAYFDNTTSSEDITIGKFNSARSLVWHTMYGGNTGDEGTDAEMGNGTYITIDPTTDEVIITAGCSSTDAPTLTLAGAYNDATAPSNAGSSSGFSGFNSLILKFTNSGVRNWATYWGDDASGDLLYGSVVVGCNKTIFFGRSWSMTSIPLAGHFNQSTGGQAFLWEVSSSTYSPDWSSYFGDGSTYEPHIAYADGTNRLFMAQETYDAALPVTNPGGGAFYDGTHGTGGTRSFVFWELDVVPTPTIPTPSSICSGNTATMTASGGSGAPYNWYNAASGGSLLYTGASFTTPSLSTTTTYYVSSGSGICLSSRTPVTVTVTPGPSAPTISSNSPICAGGTLNLTSNTVSGATYAWSGPGSYTSSSEDPTRTSVTTAMTGTYSCTVTLGGCTSSAATTSVTINAIPSAPTISSNTPVCAGASINLTSNTISGATYAWTGPNSFTSSSEDPTIASSTASMAGTYSCAVTVAGCPSSTATTSVAINPVPTAPTISSNTPVCEGTSINLTSNTISGATYAWTGPASFTSSSEDPSIASATTAMAGTYNCTVTVSGCTSSTSSTTVAVTAAPLVTAANSGTVCVGNSINLTPATGGTWSSNATGVATVTNGGVVSGVSGGSANMTFTSTATGCSSIGSGGNITVNALPSVTVPGSGEVCVNGNITLSPTTGGTWSSLDNTVATITNAGVVTGVSAGNADMTFTNTTTGCTSTAASGSVTVDPLEDASFTYPASTYCITSPSDPIATVTGVAGGTFSINNGGTIASITGEIDLDANGVQNYTVTYTTGGTCAGVETAIVNVTSGPLANFSYTNSPYCGGTGTADVTYGAGGSAGVFAPVPATTDLVINSTTGAVDLNASLPGTYTVENDIVASGGCAASYATSDITITAQEDATYSYGASNTFCESATNPTATITGTPGGVFTATPAGITVDGTTGEIDLSASTFGATYTLRYITPGTCSDTLNIDVTLESSPTVPTAGTTAGGNTICVGESADITASGSAGTGVTYAVFDAMTAGTNLGTTPLTVSPTTTTTYYVESFNINGCGNVGGRQAVTVTVNALPTIDAGADETICPTDNVTLTATGTGTVVWSTTETTSSITVTPAVTTTYTVTLTDANTCVNTDDVIVTVVTNGGTLVAEDDAFTVETDTPITMDVLLNDIYGGNTSNIILVPSNGVATADINGSIGYQSDAGFIGIDSLTYEICDVTCATICDTAVVVITVEKTIDFSVPGGFSPNGDNINDVFVIQGLEEYPNNNLSIFNRWGSIIFQAAPYNNDWDGSATEGVVLSGDKVTSGTYFYILEIEEGVEPLKGSIEIKRD